MTATLQKVRGVRYLDDGKTPHFRFFSASAGVYNVFVTRSGGDVLLGQVQSSSPIPHSPDPGAWCVFGESRRFDSAIEAATHLFEKEFACSTQPM